MTAQLLFGPADHAEVPVIADAAVVLDAVDLVLLVPREPGIADLSDDHLHLERLELAREGVADRLGVGVRERAAAHVVAAVLVSLDVRITHTDLPELIELAELADTSERDPVIDLADLRERGRVLRHEQDPAGVFQRDARLPPADALAGI